MALVQIQNPEMAHNRTVVASEALTVGMGVKLVQGTAKGEPCQVSKLTAADMDDATLMKGIVTHIQDDDEVVDFIYNPVDASLTLNTGSDNTTNIAAGTNCVFWYGKPVVVLHGSVVDATLNVATVREGAKVAINTGTSKIGLYNSGAPAQDAFIGTVYQTNGTDVQVIVSAF
jgi:hypothetical protein